ncbi:MAG TPA: TIGR03435 family protein [Bryobacteraceae bacterium]
MCSGGPGTASPGIWRCSNVPLAFLIIQAYGFEAYQFQPSSSCCQADFDIAARVPERTTREQFRQMLQNLLAERLKLKFHYEQKGMAIFELTVGKKGLKMKESAPEAVSVPEEPGAIPEFSIDHDGCPVFAAGRGGRTEGRACNRWTGFSLSVQEIAKMLSFNLGRKVVDGTGLKGKYDVDMKWYIDVAWQVERLAPDQREQIGELPADLPHGPSLMRAVRDQLGLELISKTGPGDIVVVDHFEKVPAEN